MYQYGIITVSDKGAAGAREDKSGEAIRRMMDGAQFSLCAYTIVPDEREQIEKELVRFADELGCNLVLTTGGTGFSKRDVTPEATKAVIEREAPGVAEAIRAGSMQITKRAMLSRAVCGIRGNAVLLNLPGSPKAVEESLAFALEALVHGLDILIGSASECARK